MNIYEDAEEIFVLVEECEGDWRELIAAHRRLEEATKDAKSMRKQGHEISVECIILHR